METNNLMEKKGKGKKRGEIIISIFQKKNHGTRKL